MDSHTDGQRSPDHRTSAARPISRDDQRPIGASAQPRETGRADDPRRHTPGGEPRPVPRDEPLQTTPPDMGQMPESSRPAAAAAFGLIGALIIILGLLALPFFIFSIVVAAPIAMVILILAAIFLAGIRRGPWSHSSR